MGNLDKEENLIRPENHNEDELGLHTSDYYFELPPELIAQDPLEDRSSSRHALWETDWTIHCIAFISGLNRT